MRHCAKPNWPHAPFEIPDALQALWDARAVGQQHYDHWQQQWQAYQHTYPQAAKVWLRRQQQALPEDFKAKLHAHLTAEMPYASMATRKASALFLKNWAPTLPELLGGSADLTCSNLTNWPEMRALHEDPAGQYLYYGVREFGMFAIMNGLALYGGFIPFGGTFLTFVDYGRNAVRMAALMAQKVIYVLTHDSIGLGEDGPTHQPLSI